MELLSAINNNRLWNKHGVHLMWALAGLLLLMSISRIAWISYSQAKQKSLNYQTQEIGPIGSSSRPIYQASDIVAANLFGDPAPVVVVKQAPVTTLNLTLQGILSASNQDQARAIIMTGKKKSELYSVGEEIKGAGASVKEIRVDEVLLNRNGATESLPLRKKNLSGDRSILTYEVRAGEDLISRQPNQIIRPQRIPNASSLGGVPGKGKARKLKKPNFTSLDKALRKMGEI